MKLTDSRVLVLYLFLLLGILPVAGQNSLQMYVKGFDYDPTDLTASNPNYRKKDGNGDVYAIIKVKSDTPGDDLNAYNFNFGMMSSTKEVHGDELWLYVQKNAKTVTITRPGYATIQRYDLKIAIQPACTYILTLSSQKPTVQFGVLQFNITPFVESTIVKMKLEGTDEYDIILEPDQTGSVADRREYGCYLYQVIAPDYSQSEGRIELNSTGVHVENVALVPNFGYLEVEGSADIAGASIYVDDKKIGTVPYKEKERFACGEHSIRIIHQMYKPHLSTFTINRGETTKLTPALEADFASITIKTAENAEIWVNDEMYGTGSWTGQLKSGIYNVECRLDKHNPSVRQIFVQTGKTETFVIESPKPIVGSIFINSSPLGAEIVLDGAKTGHVTPYQIDSVLIGNHEVTLQLKDYAKSSKNVIVTEGECQEMKVALKSSSSETGNDKTTKTVKNNVSKTASGNPNKSGKPSKTFAYLQGGYQIGSCSGIPVTFGTYLGGFNIEASVFWGTKSEQIYWWWNSTDTKAEYKVKTSFDFKLGYGIRIGQKFMLTPQLGYEINRIKDNTGESKCYVCSGSAGVKFDYYIGRHFGIFAAPEYHLKIVESDTYQKLSEASSVIAGYGQGFNARFGLSFVF